MDKVKLHLIPAIITALTTLMVLVIAEPFGGLFDSLLKGLAIHVEKLQALRIMVSLIIVIISLMSYILYLRKKFHFKKRFKFGVYWKEHTPFCPHCGGRLVQNDTSYLDCISCEERLVLPFGGKNLRLKEAIEELKKDGL